MGVSIQPDHSVGVGGVGERYRGVKNKINVGGLKCPWNGTQDKDHISSRRGSEKKVNRDGRPKGVVREN